MMSDPNMKPAAASLADLSPEDQDEFARRMEVAFWHREYQHTCDRLVESQAEVAHLTAELVLAEEARDVWRKSNLTWKERCERAEAREKALREITAEMLDLHGDGLVSWVRVCNEWDRRAASVT